MLGTGLQDQENKVHSKVLQGAHSLEERQACAQTEQTVSVEGMTNCLVLQG